MPEAIVSLAVLACPVGMGLMMWFMMRGGKQSPPAQGDTSGNSSELARLRAEIDQLRAAQRDSARDADRKAAGR